MPFTNYGLDKLVSQQLSKLSKCGAPEVTGSFPESNHWVSNSVLDSLGFERSPEMKRFAFLFLRRAEAAFVEYDYAREALSDYVAASPRRPYSLYFRALHHFEMTIAMVWQAYNFVRKLTGINPYEKGDDSRYGRLALIYNASRYWQRELPSDHLHNVWIGNEGIYTAKHSITFEELKLSLEEIGRGANRISSGKKPGEDKSL